MDRQGWTKNQKYLCVLILNISGNPLNSCLACMQKRAEQRNQWPTSKIITPIQVMLEKGQLRKGTKANFGNFCLTEFRPPEGLVSDSSFWFLTPASSIRFRVAHGGNSDCAYEQHSLKTGFQ